MQEGIISKILSILGSGLIEGFVTDWNVLRLLEILEYGILQAEKSLCIFEYFRNFVFKDISINMKCYLILYYLESGLTKIPKILSLVCYFVS